METQAAYDIIDTSFIGVYEQKTQRIFSLNRIERREKIQAKIDSRRSTANGCVTRGKKDWREKMTASIPLFKIKRCATCRKDLLLSEFYRSPAVGGDGYQYNCKNCIRAHEATPERRKQKMLYSRNRRITISGRATDLRDQAKYRAKIYKLEFDLTREWILTRLETGCCELSGVKFVLLQAKDNFRHPNQPYSPSIDRINSDRGYTQDNCRVICWALNQAFADWGEDIFNQIHQAYLKKKNGLSD